MANSLIDTLSEECQAMQSLLDLMKQEQEHLIKADIEGLTALTESKNRMVMRINDHTGSRYAALVRAGFSADDNGMRAALAQLDLPEAIASWDQLVELGKQAREINRVNGLLINKHLVRNHGALSALQGTKPGGNIYGRDGQSQGIAAHRRLVIG